MPYVMNQHVDSKLTECPGTDTEVVDDHICYACGIPEQPIGRCKVCNDLHNAHWKPDDLRDVPPQE